MTIPLNDDNLAKMREVAGTIQGTCKSLDSVLQEVFGDEDLTAVDFAIELLQELDSITMECESCNWWFETGELDDDQVCPDC